MNTRGQIWAHFDEVMKLEKEMRTEYQALQKELKNEEILSDIRKLEGDEKRHIDIVTKILSVIQKNSA